LYGWILRLSGFRVVAMDGNFSPSPVGRFQEETYLPERFEIAFVAQLHHATNN
jgi:hypothetical protein